MECSDKFVKKVLLAIETEELLYNQNLCNDSIKFTPWMDFIKEFVLASDNSRPVPGKETVSIKYGVRREKYILLKSKYDIAKAFKLKYPDCKFEASTLIREFPQNAISPTSRDMERNSCPTHCNIRRLNKALHKIGVAKEVPVSCREMVWLIMCNDSEGANIHEPVTYRRECAYSECEKCPELDIDVPKTSTVSGKQKKVPDTVTFSQWENAYNPAKKKKKTFGLVKHVVPVGDAVQKRH